MEVLSRTEAANFIGCSIVSLYRMMRRGTLDGTYFKVGSKTLFIAEKLKEWALNGGEQEEGKEGRGERYE